MFAEILWEARVTNVGIVIVSFCVINVINSVDTHSLHKADCEIIVSKDVSLVQI